MNEFSISDRFFLIGHDEFSGRPVVSDDLLGAGLLAALLAELTLAGQVDVSDGRVRVTESATLVTGPIRSKLFTIIQQVPEEHLARVWMDNLADDAYELTARRLVAAGIVQRVQSRRLFGRVSVRFPGNNLYEAARPQEALRFQLAFAPEEMSDQDTVCAAFLSAVGGATHLTLHSSREPVLARIEQAARRLPDPLRLLVDELDAAVASLLTRVTR